MKLRLFILVTSLFLSCSLSGQKSNIVPAENFPQAKPAVDNVQNLEIKPEPVLSYVNDVVYVTRDGMNLHLQIVSPGRQFGATGGYEGFPCIIYVQGSA